ncbi:MAG: peptide chain release factor aRF-1 [Candidatus Hodarchaeota archaeon]
MSNAKSFQRFRLKKMLELLEGKKGYHTELVSLYIPPGRQLSDVTNYLKQEHGTAANIKSKSTRKNVMDSITSVIQRLKTFQETPPTGLVIFCGAIPQNGQGTEKIEQYVVVPPEPINVFKYHCNSGFFLDPLRELLIEKGAYGLMIIDRGGATYAILRGRYLEIVRNISSGVPRKQDAGGQSQRRFERIVEQVAHEFYTRAGEYANDIFLQISDLKGLIIGGPGPTKEKFADGGYLDYRLRDKIIAVLDVGYTDEMGVKELLGRASTILKSVRYMEEKAIIQEFLGHLARDTGLVTYGEKEVRSYIEQGIVGVLLLSEGLNLVRATVECPQCDHKLQKTLKENELEKLEKEITEEICPKCSSPQLDIKVVNIIEELGELAEQTGTKVELISTETEEGVELLNLGGIAAMLRFKPES